MAARFDNLTAARFVAALMVYMHHGTPIDDAHPSFWRMFATNGYIGVSFFFIVSGFVLGASNLDKLGQLSVKSCSSFYWKRVVRIVPLCFLLATPMILQGWHAGDPALWPFLTFTQAWWSDLDIAMGIYAVAWTLSVEMFFYLTFPFIAALLRPFQGRSVGVVLLIAGLAVAAAGALYFGLHPDAAHLPWGDLDGAHRWLYRFPAMRFGEFLAGIGIYLIVKRGALPLRKTWAVSGLCLCVVVLIELMGSIPIGGPWWVFPYSLPLAGIVLCLARLDALGLSIKAKLPIILGEASFAFYLIHQTYMRAVFFPWFDNAYGNATAQVVTLVATCCASVGLFTLIEAPVRKTLLRLTDVRSSLPSADISDEPDTGLPSIGNAPEHSGEPHHSPGQAKGKLA